MDPLDVAGGVLDAFKLGYNLYTNKRDFDYQKALQQQIFEREDTAVQRRMSDLQAAGLNPNLAAGSAAGAGSVVSRSNTNDLGSALDTMMAVNSLKQQKQQVENLKKQYELLTYQTAKYQQDWAYERVSQLANLGFNPQITFDKRGKIVVEGALRTNQFSDTPLGELFSYNIKNQKNSSEYLQKELNWFVADQFNNYLKTIGTFVPKVNFGFKNFKK